MINIEQLSNSVPRSEEEYLGQDGLLHCKKCGEALEVIIDVPIIGKKKVRCICSCMKKVRDEAEERAKRDELDRNRRICFAGSSLMGCTFEKSDETEHLKMAKNYVRHFDDFRSEGKGLLLYGTVGTGKSHMAACIANDLIEEGFTVLMTNFATMVNILQSSFEGRQEYINSLNRYTLLIIDDLGAERKSDYMQEQVFNIIDARCRSGLPMIITSNLTMQELTEPTDIMCSRIYDRILERCHPIEVTGTSRRIDKGRKEFKQTKMLLKGD